MMTQITITPARGRRFIALWLFCLCGFIGFVVLVGGITRLTDSGLSITQWKPVTGIIPPLNAQDWQNEFVRYQAIPEYRLINQGMSLSQFKAIYWWEWGHRLLARMTGFVFLIPFVWFWSTGKLARRELPKFILLFLLGGAQGAMGWYMVKSGLSLRVDVSQYRLAAHLGLAFLIYGTSLWMGLTYWRGAVGRAVSPLWLRAVCVALCLVLFVQILLGALVAGLDAGLTYNSWPLMDGYWIPPGMHQLSPLHLNFFENITMVQFNHRWGGAIIVLLVLGLWAGGRRLPQFRFPIQLLIGFVLLQFALGVWTLLWVAPLGLAAAHQMGALGTFSAAIWVLHRTVRAS